MTFFYMTLLFNETKMFYIDFCKFSSTINTYPFFKQQVLPIVVQMKTTIFHHIPIKGRSYFLKRGPV